MDNFADVLFNKTEHDNNSVNAYDEIEDAEQSLEAIAIPTVFGIIFGLGCLGNGTILYLVAKHTQLKTIPNMLIVNLAAGDLLVIVVCIPFTGTIYTFPSWMFGESLCKLNEFLQTISVAVSIFTLTALSVERYKVIVYPASYKASISCRHITWIVILIWAVSVIIGIPDVISAHVSTFESTTGEVIKICVHYPPTWSHMYPKVHSLARFIVLFALPLLIITFCYVRLTNRLLQPIADYDVAPPQNGGEFNSFGACKHTEPDKNMLEQIPRKGNIIKRREHLAKLVLLLVVFFALCWFPRHIYLLWYHFDSSPFNHFWHIFKMVGFCLTFINSCINPWVIYSLDFTFKHYFQKHLCCCCYKQQSDEMIPLGDQAELSVTAEQSSALV
jgi:gastrin-releasing peptide receptor